MTNREKFNIFFCDARCRKVGRKYVVTCCNYETSTDRITASEANTAEKAWANAWGNFKEEVLHRLSRTYNNLWIELPNGVLIPNTGFVWSWQEFREDPEVRHLWVDILKPAPRGVSTLDLMFDGFTQLESLEVCD